MAHRTSDPQREVRAQLAVRQALVRTRTRYISVVHVLLRREGQSVASGQAQTFATRVERLALPAPLRATVTPLLALFAPLNAQIAELNDHFAALAAEEAILTRLCTVPNIVPADGSDLPRHPRSRRPISEHAGDVHVATHEREKKADEPRARYPCCNASSTHKSPSGMSS